MLPLRRGNRAIGTKYQEIVRLFNSSALKTTLHKHVSSSKSLTKIVLTLSKAQAGSNRKVSSSQLFCLLRYLRREHFQALMAIQSQMFPQHNMIPRPVIIQQTSLEGPSRQFQVQPAVRKRATVYQVALISSYIQWSSEYLQEWRSQCPSCKLLSVYVLSQWITFPLIFNQMLAYCNLCPFWKHSVKGQESFFSSSIKLLKMGTL